MDVDTFLDASATTARRGRPAPATTARRAACESPSAKGAKPAAVDSESGTRDARSCVTRGVELMILDAQGRCVSVLLKGEQPAGEHRILWDARREDGVPVSPGADWAQLRVGGRHALPAQRIVVER